MKVIVLGTGLACIRRTSVLTFIWKYLSALPDRQTKAPLISFHWAPRETALSMGETNAKERLNTKRQSALEIEKGRDGEREEGIGMRTINIVMCTQEYLCLYLLLDFNRVWIYDQLIQTAIFTDFVRRSGKRTRSLFPVQEKPRVHKSCVSISGFGNEMEARDIHRSAFDHFTVSISF